MLVTTRFLYGSSISLDFLSEKLVREYFSKIQACRELNSLQNDMHMYTISNSLEDVLGLSFYLHFVLQEGKSFFSILLYI